MGTDVGHIIMFGVKTNFGKLFEVSEEETYGCSHKEQTNMYCPLCGKKAKHTVKKTVPLIPLQKNFDGLILSGQPILNDKYFVHYDMYGVKPETPVYIGVTMKILQANYGYCSCHEITTEEIAANVKECEELVEFLSVYGINVSIEDCKLHVIWYAG